MLEGSEGFSSARDIFPSLSEAEFNHNHTHVLDLFDHRAGLEDEPFYDSRHPDFQAACEFGRLMAASWAAKLAEDFPGRRFRVYFTRDSDPIVRFHQVREREPAYLDPRDWPEDAVAIHEVGYD